jgi:hypothetical protein
MKKLRCCLVGAGLAAVVLSGCSAPDAGIEPVASAVTAVGEDAAAGRATSAPSTTSASGAPSDRLTVDDEEFWVINQAPLGIAAGAIEEQFPDEFAYAFFDESSALHVGFAETAPAEAVALLRGTGLAYVVIESVGFNALEYQAAADSVSVQIRRYVTEERQAQVAQYPTFGPGVILVSFQSKDPRLLGDPGLAESVILDAPFRIVFDFTNTTPVDFDFDFE